jgi:hypothetical protein
MGGAAGTAGGTAGTAGGTAGTAGGTAGTAGGTAGTTGSAGSTGGAAATCVNGDISYPSGSQTQMHVCPNHDCWIDVATGSAACMHVITAGTPPFRTCRTPADCSGAAYCAAWGDTSEIMLGAAMCIDGVCDWAAQTTVPCVGTFQYCWQTGCMTVQPTTSGGFPWTGAGGSTGGSIGVTGAGGGTSGGFPWTGAAGSSGASDGGVAGASGTGGVGGTTSEQDASQPADATGN